MVGPFVLLFHDDDYELGYVAHAIRREGFPLIATNHDLDYFTALIADPAEDVGLLIVSDTNYKYHFREHVEARQPELRVLITSDATRMTEPRVLRTLINCITALVVPEPDYLAITRAIAWSLS